MAEVGRGTTKKRRCVHLQLQCKCQYCKSYSPMVKPGQAWTRERILVLPVPLLYLLIPFCSSHGHHILLKSLFGRFSIFLAQLIHLRTTPSYSRSLLCPGDPVTVRMPGGVDYGEFGGSLPAIASLNASYSTTRSLPSPHYLVVPPGERKVISDVRRTFCLFVTFDLLFISLLWIIELNVSTRKHTRSQVSSGILSTYLFLPFLSASLSSPVDRILCTMCVLYLCRGRKVPFDVFQKSPNE